jgi:hypothetical protein
MNSKNTDYFTCDAQNESLMAMRKSPFADMKEINVSIRKLNKDFGCKEEKPVVGLVCNMKSLNAYIKCIYKDCKYEHWFTYDKGGKLPKNIKYARSINKNHSMCAHKSGVERD